MNLSVCIITKNECVKLRKCLESLRKYDWEIVVVDTGSGDDTVKMAKEYTDSIYYFEWCNDFAKAKNYAISKAKNDLVMVIDSDEYIKNFDVNKFCSIISKMDIKNSVGRIYRINEFVRGKEEIENNEYINRIFDRRYFCYFGRIHEQIVRIEDVNKAFSEHSSYLTFLTEISILHDGYNGSEEQLKEKAKRNLNILLEEYECNKDDTYILYQIGKSYYMSGEYINAIKYYELALGYDVNPKLEYVIDMIESYGYALINTEQAEVALSFVNIYDEFGDSADFKFLMGLIFMNNMMFDEAIDEFIKATKYKTVRTTGKNSYLAYYNAGVINECLGRKEEAKKFYKKCGDYNKAKTRLNVL
ncbi:MAG: glycosyltransferase family 2 protein [Lachnospiraceae bacterium]|nr:glycosyltransferase family 2 protein [Lachnospiraceae bacterium]